MSIWLLLGAMYIGVAYASWPVVGNYLGLSGSWIAFLTIVGTALPMVAVSIPGMTSSTAPLIATVAIVLLVGLWNGTGMVLHSFLAGTEGVNAGMLGSAIYVIMVVAAAIGNALLQKAPITGWHFATICGAALTIYCASRI